MGGFVPESADRVRVVGRYALYGAIASGGMATVHLGRLLGPVGFSRTVAIKRLHGQYAQDPEFVSMFLDEARLAARIRHPNVVPTLDVVATSGELFLVMEYVPGESLSRLARAAREKHAQIPPRVVSAIITAVLHGLHAAHEAKSERGSPLGIVHRDVSPQNVLLGIDGVARVLDFGVAKAAGRTQQTREGQIKGKLSYMAPEQLRGAPVNRQCDIYAAGVVLWELLTGERLFSADNEGALLAKVLDGKVDPPSRCLHMSRSQTLNMEAHRGVQILDAVTLRALCSEPGDRFTTAREMAIAIERAVPPATTSEVSEWVEAIAADVLHQRAELVAEIESSASMSMPKPDSLMSSLGGATRVTPAPIMGSVTQTEIAPGAAGSRPGGSGALGGDPQSQLSSISVAAAAQRAPPGPRRTWPAVLAGVAGTLAAVAVVLTLVAVRTPRSADLRALGGAATATATASAPPAANGAPAANALPAANGAPAAPDPSAATAVAGPTSSDTAAAPSLDARPAASALASRRRAAPAKTAPGLPTSPAPPAPTGQPAPTAPAPSDCFWFDAKGVKHINAKDPRCLQ